MFPSVIDVLSLAPIRPGRPEVIVGHDGLSGPVRWVHAAEVTDVGRLLRGRELVLTTGVALPDDPGALTDYVQELVQADAAGIVLELGRRWDAPPEAMVRACQAAGLPLITLSHEVPFIAVTEAVGELVISGQVEELRATDVLHRTFTRLSVEGAEPDQILAEVRRLAGVPVVLETTRHAVLAYDVPSPGASGGEGELLDGWEARSRAVAVTGRTGYDPASGWLVTVVGARGVDWGRLILVVGEEPVQQRIVLAERAASALALQRLAARDRDSLERQSHRAVLNAITGQGPASEDVEARSEALGVPLRGRRLVGLVVAPVAAATDRRWLVKQDLLRELAETAAGAARELGVPALVAVVGDDAVQVVLSLPVRTSETRRVDEFAAALHQGARSMRRPVPLVVASGGGVAAASAAGQSLDEARHVADAAGRDGSARVCHRLADVRLRGLVHLLADDPRLAAFAERELGPIEEHDANHGTHFVDLVRAAVVHGGNKSAAAAALHISRATFYERWDRVEVLFGLDLADAESRSSLHVALISREIAGER